MADFIDPQSGSIYRSVHTPTGEANGWVKNPLGLEEVLNIPAYYRVVEDGRVRQASGEERTAIDAKRLPIIKAIKLKQIIEVLAVDLELEFVPLSGIDDAVNAFAANYKAAYTAIDQAQTAADVASVSATKTR